MGRHICPKFKCWDLVSSICQKLGVGLFWLLVCKNAKSDSQKAKMTAVWSWIIFTARCLFSFVNEAFVLFRIDSCSDCGEDELHGDSTSARIIFHPRQQSMTPVLPEEMILWRSHDHERNSSGKSVFRVKPVPERKLALFHPSGTQKECRWMIWCRACKVLKLFCIVGEQCVCVLDWWAPEATQFSEL